MILCGATLAGAGACGNGDGVGHRPSGSSVVIRVPADARTIQGAVDVAKPGDLVLISPGVYPEAVQLSVQRLTIRGTDRNNVIIDGQFTRDIGVTLLADGDSVENLTVRDFADSGAVATGVRGFRFDHVTAYNNRHYGLSSVHATGGSITGNYASGQATAGISVARCKPCNTDVADNDTERNNIGMALTNASASLYVHDNRIADNRVGLTIGTDAAKEFAPQAGAIVVGNAIVDNAQPATPGPVGGEFGVGIDISGGSANMVAKNLITGNERVGVSVTDAGATTASNNQISRNVLAGNGPDLSHGPGVPTTNSWWGNTNLRGGDVTTVRTASIEIGDSPPAVPFEDGMVPSPQPQRAGPIDDSGPPVAVPAAIDPLSAAARANVPAADTSSPAVISGNSS